jgi:hypothetical protein
MNLAAVVQNLAAISAELKAEVSRPLSIAWTPAKHEPQPHIRALMAKLDPLMGEETGPCDLLLAMSHLCGERKRRWLRDGFVSGSDLYEQAEVELDCASSNLRGDYVGEQCENGPDYFEVSGTWGR